MRGIAECGCEPYAMLKGIKEIYRSEVPQFLRAFIGRIANRIRSSGKFAVGLVFIISVWLVWAAFGRSIIDWWSGSKYDSYENVGQFGDSFGSLNTLFAGIAALGATLVYLMQKEELRENRARDAKSQFENTFFQLLEVFNQTVNSIVYRPFCENAKRERELSGREAIVEFYSKVKHQTRRTIDIIECFADQNVLAAEIECPDAAEFASRWGEIVQRPVQTLPNGRFQIALDTGALVFLPSDSAHAVLAGIELQVASRARVMRAGQALGCIGPDGALTVCGVRVRLTEKS